MFYYTRFIADAPILAIHAIYIGRSGTVGNERCHVKLRNVVVAMAAAEKAKFV